MIIPSFLYQILLFQNEDKTWTKTIKPEANGYALVKTSDNKKVIVKFVPNFKGKLKKGQVYEWFANKSKSLVKSDEIKEIQTSLAFSDTYINQCKKIEQEENRKLSNKEKKEILEEMAKTIAYNRNRIEGGIVVSSAISTSKKEVLYEYKGEQLPLYIARALFFEYGKPSTTGLYIVANKNNDIPISISKVKDKDFYSISTNIFTSYKNKILLLGMMYRTSLLYKDKQKAIFGYFKYKGNNQEIKKIVDGLNKLAKTKDIKNIERYARGIKEFLYPLLINNPKESISLFINIPLTITKEDFKSIVLDDISGIIKNLKNFDTLNKKDTGKKCIQLLEQDEFFPQTVFAVYNIASINSIENQNDQTLFKDVEHWGFMLNQIKSYKTFLSNRDFKSLYSKVKNIK